MRANHPDCCRKRNFQSDQVAAEYRRRHPFLFHILFTVLLIAPFFFLIPPAVLFGFRPSEVTRLEKEFIQEESKRKVTELLNVGDEFVERKSYRRALEAYESVFSLDPENVKASAKIDLLKKQMRQENADEAGKVIGGYDEEIHWRTKNYWQEAQTLIQAGKIGQARFELQKILLLDPLNKQAEGLYAQLNRAYEARKTL